MQSDLVYIIDDDDGFRDSASWMLEGHGYQVKSYGESEKALSDMVSQKRDCRVVLLLDVRMPMMSGLEVHDVINERGIRHPVVYMTGHGDVALAVEAMSKGAVTFLEKPLDEAKVLNAIESALVQPSQSNTCKVSREERGQFLERMEKITKREAEIMHGVADGKSSLVLAADLGISVKTVDMHRGRVLRKLGVTNAQQLTKMVMLCL